MDVGLFDGRPNTEADVTGQAASAVIDSYPRSLARSTRAPLTAVILECLADLFDFGAEDVATGLDGDLSGDFAASGTLPGAAKFEFCFDDVVHLGGERNLRVPKRGGKEILR